jgi:transcriptional regulator with XRE-family HTH domain
MRDKEVMEVSQVCPKLLFGSHLRKLRSSKGWSQERLAQECGLDRSYVGGVERGERNISLENIVRISKALHVSPSELLDCFPGEY